MPDKNFPNNWNELVKKLREDLNLLTVGHVRIVIKDLLEEKAKYLDLSVAPDKRSTVLYGLIVAKYKTYEDLKEAVQNHSKAKKV